jgi:membrane associated rhomboid family serine protease
MIKILEIIGFILVGGTVYSYLGMIGSEFRWPVFFGCAGGALAIIIYRKKIRQKENSP